MTNKPRAYRLDRPDVVRRSPEEIERSTREQAFPEPEGRIIIEPEPEEIVEAADGAPVPMGASSRRAPWLTLLLGSVSALVMLALGLAFEALIRDLFRAAPALGWVGLGLAALALISLLALVTRELRGVWRERQIESLRERAMAVLASRDASGALGVAEDVAGLYAARPETARGRTRVAALREEILEAEDRLIIVERELLRPLDDRAKRIVAEAAKQVSLVTALSPRAIVDVAFVLFTAARLLRRVSRTYGGRPGFFGFMRLSRAALSHLTVTGGVAVGDSLLQQALGLGLAARLSAKLGEGVLNGLMTARFGLAAIAVCRPLPFAGEDVPRIGDVAGELLSRKVIDEAQRG